MDRWVLGLLLAFGAVFFANGLLVYFAVENPAQIVDSYQTGDRKSLSPTPDAR
jgi:hypothetical protein